MIDLSSHRGHSKSIVIVANLITKCLCSWIMMISEKMIQLWWNRLERGKGDLATVAAHAIFRMSP